MKDDKKVPKRIDVDKVDKVFQLLDEIREESGHRLSIGYEGEMCIYGACELMPEPIFVRPRSCVEYPYEACHKTEHGIITTVTRTNPLMDAESKAKVAALRKQIEEVEKSVIHES